MSNITQLITDHLDIWTAAETEKKSGRGRASGNANSVYGIKKLRELILELAVRGKLVPQDPNDEPAGDLLKRILAEKAKLVAEGKIKKDKPLSAITTEERPRELPDGWVCTRLADIVNILNGRAYKKEELLDSGTPVLRVGNLFTSDHWYYSDLELEEEKYCNQGDLLFAWSASFGPFLWEGERSIFHYHIWKLDFYGRDLMYKRYLYTFLLEQTQKIKSAGHGVMMIHMTKEKMEKLVTCLPPLAEQHRIVAKVDELMALCDQLEAQHNNAADAHELLVSHLLSTLTQSQDAEDFKTNWQRIATHFDTLFTTESSIDALKQTLLLLAVMGKLVPQDPNDEPAREVHPDKAKLVEIYTDLAKLPKNWRLKKLINVSSEIVDCPHSTPKWTTAGMPCVRTSQFRAGHLDLENMQYVSEETYNDRIQRLTPKKDDILYSREGGILGVACRVPEGIDLCLGQRMMLIRAGAEIRSEYLELLLNSPLITSIAREMTIGGAAPRVNVSTVKAYPIPLPAIEEQNRIVAKVAELLTLCEHLKSRVINLNQMQKKMADVLAENAVA